MMSLVIGIGVVLVLAILYMIFRIGNLIGVVKGRGDEIDESANGVNAWLFLLFLISSLSLFFWYSFSHKDEYYLPIASEHGLITDELFDITMILTVFSFTIIFIGMFWLTFKYRYNKNRRAEFISDNHVLEIVWTVIPAIVLALLIFRGLRT